MKKLFSNNRMEEDYSDVITKVHTEFNTAGEKLYQKALAIINSAKLLNEDKVKRLVKMGFVRTKEVIQAEEILKKRSINEELVKRITYYREQYPLHKFITEQQVGGICQKYSLIYGKANQYTGFVPEKNLKIMEAFVLKEKDGMYYYSTGSWMSYNSAPISYEEYKTRKKETNDVYIDTEFLIAAPAKDFNIPTKQHIVDHKIVDKPIPDPVVLAPVQGGYLIVTAWGEEASDPLVVNDINN